MVPLWHTDICVRVADLFPGSFVVKITCSLQPYKELSFTVLSVIASSRVLYTIGMEIWILFSIWGYSYHLSLGLKPKMLIILINPNIKVLVKCHSNLELCIHTSALNFYPIYLVSHSFSYAGSQAISVLAKIKPILFSNSLLWKSSLTKFTSFYYELYVFSLLQLPDQGLLSCMQVWRQICPKDVSLNRDSVSSVL